MSSSYVPPLRVRGVLEELRIGTVKFEMECDLRFITPSYLKREDGTGGMTITMTGKI